MIFSWFCIFIVVRLGLVFCVNDRLIDILFDVLDDDDMYSSFGVLFILCLMIVVMVFFIVCVDVFG